MMRGIAMIGRVKVEHLPKELSFPEDLQPKVHYDDQGKQLIFEGFMSKATFDRLYRLAEDREYRRALEELFQVCTFDDAAQTGRHPSRAVMCMVAVGATAALIALLTMVL
jgi:hypothetical protein